MVSCTSIVRDPNLPSIKIAGYPPYNIAYVRSLFLFLSILKADVRCSGDTTPPVSIFCNPPCKAPRMLLRFSFPESYHGIRAYPPERRTSQYVQNIVNEGTYHHVQKNCFDRPVGILQHSFLFERLVTAYGHSAGNTDVDGCA